MNNLTSTYNCIPGTLQCIYISLYPWYSTMYLPIPVYVVLYNVFTYPCIRGTLQCIYISLYPWDSTMHVNKVFKLDDPCDKSISTSQQYVNHVKIAIIVETYQRQGHSMLVAVMVCMYVCMSTALSFSLSLSYSISLSPHQVP